MIEDQRDEYKVNREKNTNKGEGDKPMDFREDNRVIEDTARETN